MLFFWCFFAFMAAQRLTELWIARRNARQVLAEGGQEVGRAHYKWIVLTHVLFFVGLAGETSYLGYMISEWWPFWLAVFVLAQALRYWAIASLGRYWNTRLIVVPDRAPIKRGPYRYYRHPNYAAIIIELLAAPLMFHAYTTAGGVSLLNAVVLSKRIKMEEEAVYRDQK